MNNKYFSRCLLLTLTFFILTSDLHPQQKTYCNPMNIDYGYGAIPNFTTKGKHRTTADPVIVLHKNKYFLFSTNQYGYWWSNDLNEWNFISRRFLKPYHKVYDELCAPAVLSLGDTLLVIGSTHTQDFPLWMSTNPTADNWKEAVDTFRNAAWDPAFFVDDDGSMYLYYGSSNDKPIYGQKVNRSTLQPEGDIEEMISLNDSLYGWERFGEHADNTFLKPFIEGAWMNKHNGKYYLQYAAPGTEFSWYSDGVYVGNNPLGPFKYQKHNPFASKPGGYARGAGHGATFNDIYGNLWHVGTITISVKNNFERRIGLWPAGFDNDDILYCNTAYGDYPFYLPDKKQEPGSYFTGWMLLNYNKPVLVSSIYGGYFPNFAVDENIKTYWSAASGKKGEWLQTDLGAKCLVNAIQINYADQDADIMGKQEGLYHQYIIYYSDDSKNWKVLVDKSGNKKDVPHDYIELTKPINTRYIKIENIHIPTGKFALSGLRVFGKGGGNVPEVVNNIEIFRGESERRNAWIKWEQSDDAVGYMIYFGTEPDKLYGSVMVYQSNEYYFTAMQKDIPYYFRLEAFNENGIGKKSDLIKVE